MLLDGDVVILIVLLLRASTPRKRYQPVVVSFDDYK